MPTGARFAVLLLSVVAAAPACSADVRPWAPFAEVHSVYAKFLNVAVTDRDRLVFHLGVKPPSGVVSPDDIQLTLVSAGAGRRIPIDGEWRMQLPLEDRLLWENPMITTNLSQGTPLVLRPQLAIAPLLGREWSTAELAQALRQANAAVRAQAGMFA